MTKLQRTYALLAFLVTGASEVEDAEASEPIFLLLPRVITPLTGFGLLVAGGSTETCFRLSPWGGTRVEVFGMVIGEATSEGEDTAGAGDSQLFLTAVEVWSSPRDGEDFPAANKPPEERRFIIVGGLAVLAFRKEAAAMIEPVAEDLGVKTEEGGGTVELAWVVADKNALVKLR